MPIQYTPVETADVQSYVDGLRTGASWIALDRESDRAPLIQAAESALGADPAHTCECGGPTGSLYAGDDCADCRNAPRCPDCGTRDDIVDADGDGRCESCTPLERCSGRGCGEWIDSDDLAPDGECAECTSMCRCSACSEWVNDTAPDGGCSSCTLYTYCEGCNTWEQYVESDGFCADCTNIRHCGNCDLTYDTSEGYCPHCEGGDDERHNDVSSYDTHRRGFHRIDGALTPGIAAIGIELEGGWDYRPPVRMVHDGSVAVRNTYRSGEVPSPVLRSFESASTFLAENYPTRTNGSCGLHVHISFEDQNRETIETFREWDAANNRLTRGLIHSLRRWGKDHNLTETGQFWNRINGGQSYCDPDASVHDRYRAINFQSYGRHGTVEIRVLPGFISVALAQSAIIHVVEHMAKCAARALRDIESAQIANNAADTPRARRLRILAIERGAERASSGRAAIEHASGRASSERIENLRRALHFAMERAEGYRTIRAEMLALADCIRGSAINSISPANRQHYALLEQNARDDAAIYAEAEERTRSQILSFRQGIADCESALSSNPSEC